MVYDPQVRSQLEALLAEKAGLAAENERLARENGGLQELLRYSVQVQRCWRACFWPKPYALTVTPTRTYHGHHGYCCFTCSAGAQEPELAMSSLRSI